MTCTASSAENLKYFTVEATVVFLGVGRLGLAHVYVCQKTLDRSSTELVFPATELENLGRAYRNLIQRPNSFLNMQTSNDHFL